jgi:TolB protein
MRLAHRALAALAFAALSIVPRHASSQAPAPAADKPPSPEDLLGNIVVVAGAGRPLPKIAVLPSLASDMEDVTIRSVVRRDLDLCGEFELLADSQAPDGLYLADSPVDVKAWSGKGVEAVVKVSGKSLGNGKAELRGQAYFVSRGGAPVLDKALQVDAKSVRVEAHRIADLLIGALTGTNGGFASHMAFASGTGKQRRVYTIDADGNGARAASPEGHTAIAPAFGRGGDLYYAASANNDEYRVYREGQAEPLASSVKGSVYGLAFSPDGAKVAASIGTSTGLFAFVGPDLASLTQASPIDMALRPTFSPSGLLAFAGAGKFGQRIYVDGKPISPDGLFASSPTFCAHPDGVRAIFAVGVGKDTDLVSTGERGGGLARLTQSQGRNGYPACSPDGRLVAFFSTRTSNEGPGLYIMRVDGVRPKRISTLLGDSLRWDPLPPPPADKPSK